MTRYCYFKLKNGAGSRISDLPETDEQIIAALIQRWGDQVLWVRISDRVLQVGS